MVKIIIFVVLLAHSTISLTQITREERKTFIPQSTRECTINQMGRQDNKNIDKELIKKYCGCIAEYLALEMTSEQLQKSNNGDHSIIRGITPKAGGYCLKNYNGY